MKSDIIVVQSNGKGRAEVLKQTEAVAVYKGLKKKDALHLRLLAEEMMGMLTAMVGEVRAEYWIQDEKNLFELHLQTMTRMEPGKRQNLLSVATSGKNAAAKGVMGKIRDIFEAAIEARNIDGVLYDDWRFTSDYDFSGGLLSAYDGSWSLNQYREHLPKNKADEWDELEKSIVANLADEVEIYIQGSHVELVIYKKF